MKSSLSKMHTYTTMLAALIFHFCFAAHPVQAALVSDEQEDVSVRLMSDFRLTDRQLDRARSLGIYSDEVGMKKQQADLLRDLIRSLNIGFLDNKNQEAAAEVIVQILEAMYGSDRLDTEASLQKKFVRANQIFDELYTSLHPLLPGLEKNQPIPESIRKVLIRMLALELQVAVLDPYELLHAPMSRRITVAVFSLFIALPYAYGSALGGTNQGLMSAGIGALELALTAQVLKRKVRTKGVRKAALGRRELEGKLLSVFEYVFVRITGTSEFRSGPVFDLNRNCFRLLTLL